MDPHFRVQDIAIEIKVFVAIRTLRFWILNKYLNKTEFLWQEQETWRFEQPNLKNVCITFWKLLRDDKKLIIKLASKARPSKLCLEPQDRYSVSKFPLQHFCTPAKDQEAQNLCSFPEKQTNKNLHLIRDEKRSSLPFIKTRLIVPI